MEYRMLGRTGVRVAPLCLGTRYNLGLLPWSPLATGVLAGR